MRLNFFGFSITNWYRHSRNLTKEQKGDLMDAIISFMENEPYATADATVCDRITEIKEDLTFMKERAEHRSLQNSQNAKKRWDSNATAMQPQSEGNANMNVNMNMNKNVNKENTLLPKSEAMSVLDFLNEKAITAFRYSDTSLTPIRQRLKELADQPIPEHSDITPVEWCKMVIEKKTWQWTKKPDMEQYLRPSTLFRKSNFDNYLTEVLTDFKREAINK